MAFWLQDSPERFDYLDTKDQRRKHGSPQLNVEKCFRRMIPLDEEEDLATISQSIDALRITRMLIVQPTHNFGDLVCEELHPVNTSSPRWDTFELAVAWLNRAGARKVYESAREFLAGGGRIHATVGLDFGSTTYEALRILLDLENGGAPIATHVFCDENPACTFHPKVFLFCNAERACLFVGSNNMTGAGLGSNVEAALGFSGSADNEIIREARQTLGAWRDEKNEPRTRRLNRELLEQLLDYGYVLTESELRARRKAAGLSRASKGKPLFGRSVTRVRKEGAARAAGTATGDVLLMRVRPRRNGKQLQISMLLHAQFMHDAETVASTDGSEKIIGYNEAKGVKNTARFEAPEMAGMKNPVARFWWAIVERPTRTAKKVLYYEIFDADSDPEGAKIFSKLKTGIRTPASTKLGELNHEETVISKSNREVAQWYRLDSA